MLVIKNAKFLDFSKIEAGKMEIIPVDYDMSSVINDLVNMVRTRADDKGLQLHLEMDCDILNSILDDMSAYSIPAEEKERWEKIRKLTSLYDYTGIISELENI